MSSFLDDFEKYTMPKQEKADNNANGIQGMSFQDVKDYFDAMQEKMRNDMKKEMLEYMKNASTQKETKETNVEKEKEKEGTENASSSNL